MAERDVRALDRLEEKAETPSGKATSRIVNYAFAAVVVALLTLILGAVNRANDVAEAAQSRNYLQDQSIALLQAQAPQITINTLANQKIVVLITKLQDQQAAMQEVQQQMLKELDRRK